MNMHRPIVVCVVAVSLAACLGANAARNLVPGSDQGDNAFWVQTKLSDELLASRLNVTNVPKASSGVPLPMRAPREIARTAQLTR